MKSLNIILAASYVTVSLYISYLALGVLPSLLFSTGFMGGFILWRWMPEKVAWKKVRTPYFITLFLFVVHKFEEHVMQFFPALSRITGVPVPELNSTPAILLLVIASFWLLIPFFINGKKDFGYFLAWTFFASMGMIELAHFVFPFYTGESYGYFPGMWSVIPLVPVAWWGMQRLSHSTEQMNIN